MSLWLQKGWLACHGEKACPFWPSGKETKQKGDVRTVWVDISQLFFLKAYSKLRWEGMEGGGRARLSCSYRCTKCLSKVEQERNKHYYCVTSFELGDLDAFLWCITHSSPI